MPRILVGNQEEVFQINDGLTVDVEPTGVCIRDKNGKMILDASALAGDYKRVTLFNKDDSVKEWKPSINHTCCTVACFALQDKVPPKPADHPDVVVANLKAKSAGYKTGDWTYTACVEGFDRKSYFVQIKPNKELGAFYPDWSEFAPLKEAGYNFYSVYEDGTIVYYKNARP